MRAIFAEKCAIWLSGRDGDCLAPVASGRGLVQRAHTLRACVQFPNTVLAANAMNDGTIGDGRRKISIDCAILFCQTELPCRWSEVQIKRTKPSDRAIVETFSRPMSWPTTQPLPRYFVRNCPSTEWKDGMVCVAREHRSIADQRHERDDGGFQHCQVDSLDSNTMGPQRSSGMS